MADHLGAVTPVEAASIEQPIKDMEKDLVTEIYKRLVIFKKGCSEMHQRFKDARQIILLQDPYQDEVVTTTDEAETGLEVVDSVTSETTIQLQTLKSTFNNCVADQMDNMPEIRLIPETPEVSEVAEDATDVIRYIMNQNKYGKIHRRRVEDFLSTGTAVTQIAWDKDMDYGNGGIAIIRWPAESLLWDPQCEDIQDSRAVMKATYHPQSWYTAHYPDKAQYVNVGKGEESDLAVPKSQEEEDSTDEEKVQLIEYWYRTYNADTHRYSINVAYVAGGALLEHAEDVYWHGKYPFVLDVFTTIEGIPVGEGMVQELTPMNRLINRLGRYMDVNARMTSQGRLLIKRGSNIDKAALMDWSQNIIEGDNINKDNLDWLQNQPFTGVVQNLMLQMQTDLKQDSGQNQFTRGETAGGVTAMGAIEALQNAGGKQNRFRTGILNEGTSEIADQVQWDMAQFMTKEHYKLITGKDGKQRKVNFSSKHLFGKKDDAFSPPPYTVQVQIQRKNPLRIQAQNELFLQAYSMAAQAQQYFPLSALFELLDVDGKERVLPLLKQSDLYMQQMQQLQAQNQQLLAENEQMKVSTAKMQELNNQYAAEQGKGMYLPQQATDQALPKQQIA